MAVPRAHAYSSFPSYALPIEEGGGGRRLFTGTPADGYGCDVCHRGATGADLHVEGLPEDGYVPGEAYTITLRWPEETPRAALMAELTDVAGNPVGSTALPSYSTWGPSELCREGTVPAADLCRLSADGDGCCRDLDPTRDACEFPGERSVLWMLDCGAHMARLVWTAPSADAGDVWFSTQMVNSDVSADVLGDGVTAVRRRLRPMGASTNLSAAVGDCHAVPGKPARGSMLGVMTLALLAVTRPRRRHGSGGSRT